MTVSARRLTLYTNTGHTPGWVLPRSTENERESIC